MSLIHFKSSLRVFKILGVVALFLSLPIHARPVVATYYAADGNTTAIADLPAEKLSHVLYAFLALCGDNEGANANTIKAIEKACRGKSPYTAVLFNEKQAIKELKAFKELKNKHPHLVLLPSFGGWTLSKPFHGMATKASYRQHFVRTAIELITKHKAFDGIDIDWEFPGGGGNAQSILTGQAAEKERKAFRLMMQELRDGLDELSIKTHRNYELTAAVNGSSAKVDAIDWKNTSPHMDYIFTMTYDFAVGNGQAAHHTNLFSEDKNTLSTENMINNMLSAGVPANKLVVGVAFYGRGWQNSDWKGNNFGNAAQATSTGSYIYQNLVEQPPKGYQYGYDDKAEAAYLYNPTNDGFISFDDKRSVTAKANWTKKMGLAGLFSWQVRQDNGDLIDAMFDNMQSKERE
jgi:GH18 family chitinase